MREYKIRFKDGGRFYQVYFNLEGELDSIAVKKIIVEEEVIPHSLYRKLEKIAKVQSKPINEITQSDYPSLEKEVMDLLNATATKEPKETYQEAQEPEKIWLKKATTIYIDGVKK